MILKVQFGQVQTHCRIIECNDIHIEDNGEYSVLICHYGGEQPPQEIHLGKDSVDHLYLMDKGQTVDHMVFDKQ